MLKQHIPKCENKEITTIRTSSESHLHWKGHLHKNPLYFSIIADFEADIEVDKSTIGNNTTNIYKQKPSLNIYYKLSEVDDVLKSGYYESPSGYNKVDWFVNEVIKIENRIYFKITK